MKRRPADPIRRLLARHDNYPETAPCLNPPCTGTCGYAVHTRGRPQLFCSKACSQTFQRQRDRLLADIEKIDAALATTAPRGPTGTKLRRQRAHAAWLLLRYGVNLGPPETDDQSPTRPSGPGSGR